MFVAPRTIQINLFVPCCYLGIESPLQTVGPHSPKRSESNGHIWITRTVLYFNIRWFWGSQFRKTPDGERWIIWWNFANVMTGNCLFRRGRLGVRTVYRPVAEKTLVKVFKNVYGCSALAGLRVSPVGAIGRSDPGRGSWGLKRVWFWEAKIGVRMKKLGSYIAKLFGLAIVLFGIFGPGLCDDCVCNLASNDIC